MLKPTDHCMPNVTPSKTYAMKTAKIYPTIDRCDRVKGFRDIDYKPGFNSFRNIEEEEYKYIFPKDQQGLAIFSKRITPRAHGDRMTVDEIDLIIREKFINERFSIQELFKAADDHKNKFVTKEALMKIFYTICDGLKVDHFYKLLERYKLNEKPVITFSDVEKVFGLPPTAKFPAPQIFHGMGHPYNVSAAFGLQLLKEAALDKDFDLKVLLPENCFEEEGVILIPQFREALKKIKITLCDEDFIRLWKKLDVKGVGSISLRQLLWVLNLQDNGKPMCGIRPTFIPLKRPKIERVVRTKPPLKYKNCYELDNQPLQPDIRAGGVSFPLIKVPKWKPKGPGGSNEYEFGKGLQFVNGLQKLRDNRPEFNRIMDILSYIFEEPFQAMLTVFKHYDSRNSGFVQLETGLKILSEYGFVIEIENLIKFLNKINCFDLNSGMNYKKMLTEIQTKGPGTCVNKVISQIIKAENQSTGLKSLRTMSVEEIEHEVYKTLHKDFMNFQSQLEKASVCSNVICEKEARRIIENIIGHSMTKEQWKDLQFQFDYCQPLSENDGENPNRAIDFRKFLNKFSKPTGICRYRFKSDLDKPIDWSNRNKKVKEYYDPPRNHAYLCRLVADVLKFRFHAIDKQYKSFPLKEQGTLTKQVLFELLNSQNCNLTLQEMEIIWFVVESHPHYSSLHYRQVLKHLMTNLYKRAEEINIENRVTKLATAEDPNIEVLKEFKKTHKDDKSKNLEYCDKKVFMALLKKDFVVDNEKLQKTIEKMSPLLGSMWVAIKKQLRQIDVVGKATIELYEMKELFIKNGFILTPDEMENLLYAFDLKRCGRFYYIEFLNEFLKFRPDEGTAKPVLHFDRVRHQLLNEKTGGKLTVVEAYKEMRKTLIKQWKSLIRAFRKIDTNKTGKLDQSQLNTILLKSGIRLSQDDLYHVFSGFDKNLDGKIDYIEFIEQLLDVFAPYPS